MKIDINYELLDKARAAKTGFSLRKWRQNVITCSSFGFPILSIDISIHDNAPVEVIWKTITLLLYYCGFFFLTAKSRSDSTKFISEQDLEKLANRLKDIFVDTDSELLKDVSCYKTEYDINFEDFILPRLEQRKYITVPVHNDWDNNTRSLVQEHIIGTNVYSLSHGEPKEQKVYQLGAKKIIK